ncbi:MBL fold metallo-hydrolase [Allorhodopirellula heiligendammensis]|uniref:Metallo-beta-lactamase L1 n=1 Tax=Allorhodopirellula heiligendammensis TaxID=2714739 RepID=A0A5C6C6D3_9BACT|nr:MBL fold metallo-hydrolase [Allorhodopirellula heiligendammensis]TWU19655.1 Metallo-beta-lactamase L1 precursor [Allorhodopirellula heiligendammensis]
MSESLNTRNPQRARLLVSSLGNAVCVALVSICLLLAGCGESADAIAIRKRLAERQLESPQYVESTVPEPVPEWSGKRNALLAPGVYGLGGLYPSAAYVIDTGDGLILIDTGSDENVVGLRNCMTEVGLQIEDVKFVLLTHAHYDHVFGANRVREVSHATVCVGADDLDVLRSANEFALFSLFPRIEFSGTPIVVDRTLNDGDRIELGDTVIHTMGCPGHTPGSMCYLAEKAGESFLFSGDVIASLRFGPATYPIFISPKFRGDAETYSATIDQLLAMDVPDYLLPGHPRQQTFSRPISIDTQQWQELLLPTQREIRTVVQRHQDDGKDFLDGSPKQIEKGLFYFGEIDGVAVYGLVDAEQSIVVNAPGGEQFLTKLQSRFERLGLDFRTPDAVLLTTRQPTHCSGLVSLAKTTLVMAPGGTPSLVSDAGSWPSLDEASLSRKLSTLVEVIALGEGDASELAYLLEIGGKRVLLTPAVPRNISLDWVTRKTGTAKGTLLEPQATDLRTLLEASDDLREQYLLALDTLGPTRPDIWLPSLPLTGQNANLYDETWHRIIVANRKLASATGDSLVLKASQ